MSMSGYSITLYSEGDEEIVEQQILMPTIPAPGMIILGPCDAWLVTDRIQIVPAQPGSQAARDNSPIMVQIIVTLARGIFKT